MELRAEPSNPPFSFFDGKMADLCMDDWVSDEDQTIIDRLTDPEKKVRRTWHTLNDTEYVKKIPTCGSFSGRSVNIYSGVLQAVCWHCRCWQTRGGARCEECFSRRRDTFKQKIQDAMRKCRPPFYLKLPRDRMSETVRRLNLKKNQYLRFPTKNGADVLIADMNDIRRVTKSVCISTINDLDLDALSDTPIDQRTSGSLGSRKVSTAKIYIATAHINPKEVSAQMEARALFKAEQVTLGADPKTLHEVEDCINAKIEAYASSIRAQGGKVTVLYVHKPCRLSYISWSLITEVKMSDMMLRALSFPRNNTQKHGDGAFEALGGDPTVIH